MIRRTEKGETMEHVRDDHQGLAERGCLVYTVQMTHRFIGEDNVPVDHGEVEITGEQMNALIAVRGGALFGVLMHDTSVELAVDSADSLHLVERRLGRPSITDKRRRRLEIIAIRYSLWGRKLPTSWGYRWEECGADEPGAEPNIDEAAELMEAVDEQGGACLSPKKKAKLMREIHAARQAERAEARGRFNDLRKKYARSANVRSKDAGAG
jgi:hypothetical protein